MKFKKQILIESAVGFFCFAVMAALFMLTVVLSRDSLFRRSQPMDILFNDVMGLRVGDTVSARGVTVGKVDRILLQKDGVHVMALLNIPIELRADYKIEVLPTSVLGGRYLMIIEGSPDAEPISTDGVLKGTPTTELIDAATATINEIRAALNDGILEDVKASVAEIRKISTGLANGEGTMGRLLRDDDIYGDIQQIATNLRQISDTIAKGEGTIGRLVNDDALYTDAQAVAANLREISDRLAKGEGMLGHLLSSDDTAYQDLAATIATFRKLSDSIAKGEGTIGKLVSDEELYMEFKALLREGRAAVDDIRETSPVTTFTSVFFGAF